MFVHQKRNVLVTCLLLICINLVASLPALKIVGNTITADGKPLVLHGVSRSGSEFACVVGAGMFDGPTDQNSINVMKSWKINIVRLPLNEDCWLGINGVKPEQSGAVYQQAIFNFVELFLNNSIYVILDLHWTANGGAEAKGQAPMPNKDHSIDFWKSVATRFKGNNAIIFDLFNEPFPGNNQWDNAAAWQCWRDGNNCQGVNYAAAGLQDLVNAVRSVGSSNICMLGGLAYSNSLAQWMTYLPNDPLKQLAASWHSYNFNFCNNPGCWEQYVRPVSQKFPVIIGEMGENDCGHGYIDALMPWADKYNISYLAWTWNTWDCSSGPALITNYDGTATNYGVGYRNHLNAIHSK